MKSQAVYITGANGFIGQALVAHLSQNNYQVFALLRKNTLPFFDLHKNIHIVYGDMTDAESLMRTIPQKAIVVNLAANPYDKKLSYEVNIGGTQKLLAASMGNKVSKFVQISSQATKIRRQGVYAKTKNASDALVRSSTLDWVILKPSLVYGGGARGLFNKIKAMAKQLPFIPVFGDGNTKVYPIEVGDFAKIVERVIQDPKSKSCEFDVGCKTPITYNTLYLAITKSRLVHIPVWMGLLMAKLVSVMPHPPIYPDNVLGSTQDTHCKPLAILKRYQFTPMSFEVGVSQILKPPKVKVAVIGLGKMGTLHMSILHTFPEVQIVALIDTNKFLYNTVKSMGMEGNFYPSLEEACLHEKIDAVYIITPTFTHLGLIKTALAHNLHIFVEKPVTLNPDQLAELKKIRTKKIIHTGYTLLNNRIYGEVARLIRSQVWGKVLGFSGRFEHGEVFGAKKGWMFSKQLSGGGVLMNPGPHFFSLLTMFFGTPNTIVGQIKHIYSPDLDDEVVAELGYKNFRGNIYLSWSVAGRDVAENTFEIKLEKATIITDGREIVVKKGKSISKITLSQIEPKLDSIFNINPKANGEAYYIENRAFIDAILGNQKTVPNELTTAMQIESTIFECYKRCNIVKETT